MLAGNRGTRSDAHINKRLTSQAGAPDVDHRTIRAMGFNRRKMDAERKATADAEAGARRATDAQMLEDAERLIGAWNERQAKRMPMLFSPTIGAAIAARFWFL